MSNPIVQIAGRAVCKLCGEVFHGPQTKALLIGQHDTRLNGYLEQLARHMHNKHPSELTATQIAGIEYAGMLCMMNFSTTDTALIEQADQVRWKIHRHTLAVRVPDERLKTKAAELAEKLFNIAIDFLPLRAEHSAKHCQDGKELMAAKLIEVLTGFRDTYEEPDKYPEPVETPTPSPAGKSN